MGRTLQPEDILNHYQVIGPLGAGGMGEVYLAHDTRLDRDVALKVLPPELVRSEERVKRFILEAKSASSLSHPHIVTIYDIGRHPVQSAGEEEASGEELHYIAMELVNGKTVHDHIHNDKTDLKTMLGHLAQAAEGLSKAHAAGIVHRDLKPGNIMVTNDGYAKVLDFGLAKLTEKGSTEADLTSAPTEAGKTNPGTVVGTVGYMSPEQVKGKKVDHRSDIFSFGCILYEAATRTRAYVAESKFDTMHKIVHDSPTPIDEINPAVPSELRRLIKRCLAKNADQRLQSIKDLAIELREVVDEFDTLSATATSASGSSHPMVALGRRPSMTALMATVVVLAVAGIAFGIWFLRGPETPAGPASIRPLTSMAGVEGAGSWSPDGTFLVFSHSPGAASLFVVPTAGGDAVPLVDSDAGGLLPRWSPDSRWIAFVSNREGRNGISLVPPLGGRVQRLADTNMPVLDFVSQLGALGGLPWSPDGRKLLFSRLAPDRSLAIWEIELESRSETQLTHPEPGVEDRNASWSFDGSRIVFSRNGNLWLLTPGDVPQPLLEDEPVEGSQAVWMPDGNRILFVSSRSGNVDLWEIDVVLGSLRQITTSPGLDVAPTVSRDGRIAYTEFSHEQDLYVVSLEERSHQRLTSNTGSNLNARISPDGARIVYDSMRTGDWEIWVIDRATGSETQLASHPASDQFPSWSPDGKQVAFVSGRDGETALWVVNADGSGGPRRLTGEHVRFGFGTRWSPDGAAIGFLGSSERGPALYELDLATGGVTLRKYGVETFDWYLDREHVVYTPTARDSAGRMEMRVVNFRTGEEDVLLEEPHTELIVARDGTAVAYCRAANHFAMQLYYLKLHPPSPESVDGLPTPEGQPVQLTDGNYHVHNGGWSPDGKEIVYTRDIDAGDIYVIEPR